MTDEKTTIILKARVVMRISPIDRNYAVFEHLPTGEFVQESKGYPHSTSAYAKLGRLVNDDTWKDLQGK